MLFQEKRKMDEELKRKSREDFERIYLGNNKITCRKEETGKYINPYIEDAWSGWMACYSYLNGFYRNFTAIRYNKLNKSTWILIPNKIYQKEEFKPKEYLNLKIEGFTEIRPYLFRFDKKETNDIDELKELGFNVVTDRYYFNLV